MDNKAIESLLRAAGEFDEIQVSGDGSHFQIIAVSAQFEGLRSVKRQQLVYAPLNEVIASGEVHAVSIKAYTPAEWQRDKKLMMPS